MAHSKVSRLTELGWVLIHNCVIQQSSLREAYLAMCHILQYEHDSSAMSMTSMQVAAASSSGTQHSTSCWRAACSMTGRQWIWACNDASRTSVIPEQLHQLRQKEHQLHSNQHSRCNKYSPSARTYRWYWNPDSHRHGASDSFLTAPETTSHITCAELLSKASHSAKWRPHKQQPYDMPPNIPSLGGY
jgi:hypothetical protein